MIGIGVFTWNGTVRSTVAGESTIDSVGLWGSSTTDIWTVGGYMAAGILHWDGSGWANVTNGTNANLLVSGGAARTMSGIGAGCDPALVCTVGTGALMFRRLRPSA